MLKLVLLGLAFYLVYIIFFKKAPLTHSRKEKMKKDESSNDMVACQQCQTYTAIEDMILIDGHYYCSNQCAKEASC